MQYKQLGKSELKISVIGFGCMSLKSVSDEGAISLINKAFDLGINFFDTADLYEHGRNEIITGNAIREKRNEIILATKVGNQWLEDGSGWKWNPRKEYLLNAVDASLKRLQTSWIDLYQLHGGTIEDPAEEIIEAFERLVETGKIRYYGISSIRPNVIRKYAGNYGITSNMMQYSIADRRPEESMLDLLSENNIGVLARGALAQGMLTGKTPAAYLNKPAEFMQNAANVTKNFSNELRTVAQTAIRYVLKQPAMSSAVIGISKEKQLKEIATTTETPEISDDEYKIIQESVEALLYDQHR